MKNLFHLKLKILTLVALTLPVFPSATFGNKNLGSIINTSPKRVQPPSAAPDFTVTTSDGQVKSLYQDYISQQKLVVIEAFFTTCPPCATHAPLLQTLYTNMQAAHPGKIEFMLLSTLITDTNVKVAQYKTSKGLTMPAVGKDGGSITALQPYRDGLFGPFQGTPTFIVIAPGSGAVFFDIRGNTPSQTMDLLQQKIEELFPKPCTIKDPFGNPLEGVQLGINAPAFDTSIVSNGAYDFSQIAALKNSNYTLKPFKTGGNTGLTTYDLVLISKHILAIEPFQCPWQILAADVNCTNSVTTFDIVTARKVILGILDSFPCGSYRFMPDSALVSNGTCQDFVGVQLGDVNAGPCNDSLLGSAGTRSTPQRLFLENHYFKAGETARIPLFFMQELRLDGLQFALNIATKALKINALESEILEDFNSGSYHLNEQGIGVSWNSTSSQPLPSGLKLLYLNVTALESGLLSNWIDVSNTGLTPEAYSSAGEIYPLHLSFSSANTRYTIAPNPASSHFFLQFIADKESETMLQVLDLQGKIQFEQTFSTVKGFNNWEIQPQIKSAGIYYLKVNGETAGKVLLGAE